MILMGREPQEKKAYDRRRNKRQYERWQVIFAEPLAQSVEHRPFKPNEANSKKHT